jgi:hypothetical protein
MQPALAPRRPPAGAPACSAAAARARAPGAPSPRIVQAALAAPRPPRARAAGPQPRRPRLGPAPRASAGAAAAGSAPEHHHHARFGAAAKAAPRPPLLQRARRALTSEYDAELFTLAVPALASMLLDPIMNVISACEGVGWCGVGWGWRWGGVGGPAASGGPAAARRAGAGLEIPVTRRQQSHAPRLPPASPLPLRPQP